MARYDLERFVEAQERIYPVALAELKRGRKESHWMWFIFPQLAGLGRSPMAQRYAIGSLDEARAYLGHARLGPRLRECTGTVLTHRGIRAEQIFGPVDAMKFRSSMTLFLRAAPGETAFKQVLSRFFDGEPDPATDELLRAQRPHS